MSSATIEVQSLSKRYLLGTAGGAYRYRTFRDAISNAATAPIRRFRQLRGYPSQARIHWALKDVSFQVQPGEVVGIIGRNGAGKSTLLKVLSRITEPTRGRIVIRGRVASLLEVGTGFHPELSGRENIYLNGSVLGMRRSEIQRKFDEIVAFAEVERFIDTPVKRYSSGMYLRLAFAVAAHLEPEILLVDEVLAVGDADFQEKCLGKMSTVAREGRTVLFVSHNMSAVQQLCSRAILIRAGQIHQEGSPDIVVAGYLGDASESEQGVFDLSAHPARAARYRSIIKTLVLCSQTGTPQTQFYPDEDLVAEISLEPERRIMNPRVAVAVEDSLGRRIMTAASYFQGVPLPDLDQPTRVSCHLQNLRLGSGRYLISVSVGTKQDGLLDSLDHVAWFTVGWRNNYGNGEPYHPVYGPVLTPSEWRSEC